MVRLTVHHLAERQDRVEQIVMRDRVELQEMFARLERSIEELLDLLKKVTTAGVVVKPKKES